MKCHARLVTLLGFLALAGCVSVPRRPPPPDLINLAAPPGFSPDIRMLTVDRQGYLRSLPAWMANLSKAAQGRPVNILALSGGGSNAAFGAGALIGLSEAHARPPYQLVTGVSAGALLAPFAFLGPSWDPELRRVFTSGVIETLPRPGVFSMLRSFFFPRGVGGRNALAALVDRTYTTALIDAVGREAAAGRMLIVATTDLDDEETMLWNLGAIAEQGGPAAYKLFRKVLTASASVPGVFPPVMIKVREGGKTYAEMHVDGSVTTPLFIAPLIAVTTDGVDSRLAGAHVYVIVNGHLGMRPVETPVNTLRVLEASFSAELVYGTRDSVDAVISLARRDHMDFLLTSMPSDYPSGDFLDFHKQHLRQLFDYGQSCAAHGLLWTSVPQAVARDVHLSLDGATSTACPAFGLQPPRTRTLNRNAPGHRAAVVAARLPHRHQP